VAEGTTEGRLSVKTFWANAVALTVAARRRLPNPFAAALVVALLAPPLWAAPAPQGTANPYDEILREQSLSLSGPALGADINRDAQVYRLAGKLGFGPDVIDRNYDDFIARYPETEAERQADVRRLSLKFAVPPSVVLASLNEYRKRDRDAEAAQAAVKAQAEAVATLAAQRDRQIVASVVALVFVALAIGGGVLLVRRFGWRRVSLGGLLVVAVACLWIAADGKDDNYRDLIKHGQWRLLGLITSALTIGLAWRWRDRLGRRP
jgi:hypothetical protein